MSTNTALQDAMRVDTNPHIKAGGGKLIRPKKGPRAGKSAIY